MKVFNHNTIVVGSGAAGYRAINALYDMGETNIALVTNGLKMGTSRNTGSDKQTYYKMSTSGDDGDSPYKMAETLFNGGCMHGDIALVEASLSAMSFYYLSNIGVPFPHDEYGQYVGYKTDHDPFTRASSAGPLTSKFMTEKLEDECRKKEITTFDRHLVIKVLTNQDKTTCVGLLTLNQNSGEYVLFNCRNVVYATGGCAGIYYNSVYPHSQIGMMGAAIEAGAKAQNLTEWQYGLASTKFRWNVSGTYQQVIPRYISTNQSGEDEKEFLLDYFDDIGRMMDCIFLKGYQWPFDASKINGSSTIDMLVYAETQQKNRRVFLDYTHNPQKIEKIDFSLVSGETYNYLEKSNALFGKPIDRLEKMNPLAIELYKDNGIDISKDYLEIDVCSQHINGGLCGNIWWESNLKHFFPVGEVNGTLGVYRPGGSALNSTQVGSYRASQYITNKYSGDPRSEKEFVDLVTNQINDVIYYADKISFDSRGDSNVMGLRKIYQQKMTKDGAFIRSYENVCTLLKVLEEELCGLLNKTRINHISQVKDVFINRDILVTQIACLSSIKSYIEKGGESRGSYLIIKENGVLETSSGDKTVKYSIAKELFDEVGITYMKDGEFINEFEKVREIPQKNSWFEEIWSSYRSRKIYG